MEKQPDNVTRAELHEILRDYPTKEDMRLTLENAMTKLENKMLWGFIGIGAAVLIAVISLVVQIIALAGHG